MPALVGDGPIRQASLRVMSWQGHRNLAALQRAAGTVEPSSNSGRVPRGAQPRGPGSQHPVTTNNLRLSLPKVPSRQLAGPPDQLQAIHCMRCGSCTCPRAHQPLSAPRRRATTADPDPSTIGRYFYPFWTRRSVRTDSCALFLTVTYLFSAATPSASRPTMPCPYRTTSTTLRYSPTPHRFCCFASIGSS